MLLKVTVLRDNNRGPEYVRQILDALHLGNRRRLPITLILARFQHSVGLCCAVPQPLQSTLEQGLLSGYEGCRAEKLPGHALAFPSGWSVQKTQLTLRPDVFPLQLQFDDLLNREFVDPITGILHRLQSDTFPSRVELTLRPASRRRRLHASRVRDALLRPALLHRRAPTGAFVTRREFSCRSLNSPVRPLSGGVDATKSGGIICLRRHSRFPSHPGRRKNGRHCSIWSRSSAALVRSRLRRCRSGQSEGVSDRSCSPHRRPAFSGIR